MLTLALIILGLFALLSSCAGAKHCANQEDEWGTTVAGLSTFLWVVIGLMSLASVIAGIVRLIIYLSHL